MLDTYGYGVFSIPRKSNLYVHPLLLLELPLHMAWQLLLGTVSPWSRWIPWTLSLDELTVY